MLLRWRLPPARLLLVFLLSLPPLLARRFTYPTYASAVEELHTLAAKYPLLVELSTAQEAFGLRSAGTCSTRRSRASPCLNWIVHVTNRRTLPDADRPEILFLGGLHGDERIGPVSTIELARFLAESYESNAWVRRLVDTRSVWIVPLTNAVGYERNERLELGLFPNRDFGFIQRPEKCMTTIAGRTVNELFRQHVFQIVVTFHGGMTSIGYPWGSFNHYRKGPSQAPDDAALVDVATAMSAFASDGRHDVPYPFGTMNDQVYPVNGGMEDWGYGASFDPASVVRCAPKSYGGYPEARSRMSNSSARALVFLVEAGPKHPAEHTLGSSEEVLTAAAHGDGHVPRNIRLSMAAIDFLRPHLELLEPAEGALAASAVGKALRVRWRAWGAAKVDSVEVLWRRAPADAWSVIPASASASASLAALSEGVWAKGATPARKGAGEHALCVMPLEAGAFELALRARVDAHWALNRGGRASPANMPPQSHLAHARTDPSWRMANGRQRVHGRTDWLSAPVAVRVARAAQLMPDATAPFRVLAGCGAVRRRARGARLG